MSEKAGLIQNLLGFLKGEPGKTAPKPGDAAGAVQLARRRLVTASVLGCLGINFLMFLRFFFPRTLFEPKTVFNVGFPSDYGFGVDEKFKQAYRIWMVRNAEGIVAIYARCTHLGCTPNWNAAENKFKCPCHGSGYDSEGVNVEGPAPRPMDRARVEILPTGEIQVDTSILYQFGTWDNPDSILRV